MTIANIHWPPSPRCCPFHLVQFGSSSMAPSFCLSPFLPLVRPHSRSRSESQILEGKTQVRSPGRTIQWPREAPSLLTDLLPSLCLPQLLSLEHPKPLKPSKCMKDAVPRAGRKPLPFAHPGRGLDLTVTLLPPFPCPPFLEPRGLNQGTPQQRQPFHRQSLRLASVTWKFPRSIPSAKRAELCSGPQENGELTKTQGTERDANVVFPIK